MPCKEIAQYIECVVQRLNLSPEKNTSDDLRYTIETVSCLGACGLAPVMLMNDEVHGQVTPEQALAIVDRLEEAEKNA